MTKAAIKQDSEAAAPNRHTLPSPRRPKVPVYLVTHDDELWPQVGAQIRSGMVPKQVDSIEDLLAAAPSGQPAIVLWDARGAAEQAAVLSHLQLHSGRFAIVVLDEAGGASAWSSALQHRQIVALATLPLEADRLAAALAGAHEELNARIALLGEGGETDGAQPGRAAAGPQIPWVTAASLGGVLIACVGALLYFRHHDAAVKPAPGGASAVQEAKVAPAGADEKAGAEEKVDALIEKAQRAMLERHYIEPSEGSALALYRSALALDPNRGEARQGLQRLAEILVSRVQSALDAKQFDLALQALETARSIDPGDSRLPDLDERIASMRAELAPSEIQAAINAQNFDRAGQLIVEAARERLVSGAKLNQLRDEVRRGRAESDEARLVELIDVRLQQDRLIDPPNDSAVFYFNQARQAGAGTAALQAQYRELTRRLTQAAHGAIDQRRFGDADRFVAELRGVGAAPAALAGLQRDLAAARAQQSEKSNQPRFADLARSRLAQGSLIQPENDNALYYVNQLRASDPQNSELPQISGAVQAQLLDRARAAIDTRQTSQADVLLQMAGGLGRSADLDALNERLRATELAMSGLPLEVSEASLVRLKKLEIDYPVKALARKVEGAVELAYLVTPKGAVANISVVDSNPPGVFDSAAKSAVSRLRYQPFLQGGKAVAVTTKIRVTFRVAD